MSNCVIWVKMMSKKIVAFLTVFCVLLLASYRTGMAAYTPPFELSSERQLLVNLDLDFVVYEKNADERANPASLTKIMTLIIALEQVEDLDATVTVKKSILDSFLGTGSSLSGLKPDEELTVRQLLYCAMVSSGNDAASIIADYVGGGSIDNFVEMMNACAKKIGAENTHFVNPHGLTDPNHYTTARDLYKIFSYGMQLPLFKEILGTTRYTLPTTNKSPARVLSTTNLMMDRAVGGKNYYSNIKGGKTGRTAAAGNCFISYAQKDGYNYLCVVLGAPATDQEGKFLPPGENQAFSDTKKLYEWAFNSFKIKNAVDENTPIFSVNVNLAANKDHIVLYPEKTVTALLPVNVDASSISYEIDAPQSIDAPVEKGQVIGTAKLMYLGQQVGQVNIVAIENVQRSTFKYILQRSRIIVSSLAFKISAGVVGALILAYIVYAIIYNRKDRRYKRVRRHKKL